MSLRYAILTLLFHQDLSGYQLLDYFDGSVGFVWHATHPQIYRELAAMDRAALVKPSVVRQSGRPDKKVYAITPQGRASLLEWVAVPAFERQLKDEALLRVFSYALIDHDIAISRLAELRTMHERRLARYREIEAKRRTGKEHPFRTGALLTLAAAAAFEESYIAWCARAPALLERASSRKPRARGKARRPARQTRKAQRRKRA